MEVVSRGVSDSFREEKEREKSRAFCRPSIVPKSQAIYGKKFGVFQPSLRGRALDVDRQIDYGFPIAEIFEVRLKSGENEQSKIHGRIKINCELYLFQRSHLNPNIIHQEDNMLELTGPLRAIQAFDKICVRFDLMQGEEELVARSAVWDPNQHAYDWIYCKSISGPNSTAQISYVVYASAVVSIIEIAFKSCRSIAVCGTITASNNMFPDRKSILFSKKGDVEECLKVEKEGEELLLPLLRSIVAVPVNSMTLEEKGEEIERRTGKPCMAVHDDEDDRKVDGRLLVDINLLDFGNGESVAKGVLEFPIENFEDEYVGRVSTKYGETQVKVTFFDLFQHMSLSEGY